MHTSSSVEKFEKSVFDMFKREARSMLDTSPIDDWEWLSLAQHHLVPTRFMDWSQNPLVALYFAVVGNPKVDGAFFALHARKKTSS